MINSKYRFRQRSDRFWECLAHTRWGWVKFVFSQRGFGLLHANYRAGGCAVTDKGLWRYSCVQQTVLGEYGRLEH